MAIFFNAMDMLASSFTPRDPNNRLYALQILWIIWGLVMIPAFIMSHTNEASRPRMLAVEGVNLILYFITFVMFLWYTPTSIFGYTMPVIVVQGFVLVFLIPGETTEVGVRGNQVVERQLDPVEVVVVERQLDPEVVVELPIISDIPPNPSYQSLA
jgi:hypothetical protein